MRTTQKFLNELFSPLETIKDQSLLKARLFAGALAIGHPLYYWAWTVLDPQPYESAAWRATASILGLVALVFTIRSGPNDRRASFWYGVASAGGTVVLASWFYVANGGNSVWLASLCVLTFLFFTITDWRFAFFITAGSLAFASVTVPYLEIGVWARGEPHKIFDTAASLIIGFTLSTAVLTRYSDVNMRGVRMRSQMRALAITAHEIRTPIAGMLLLSEALEERLREILQQTGREEVREAHALTKDLVATCRDSNELISTYLANANPSKPFANSAAIALASVAQDAITSVQRANGGRGPTIALQVSQDFVVMGDRVVLRQVLVNLLNNARNAVRRRYQASTAGHIRVDVEYINGGRVTVNDDGIGIARADLGKIFEAFYTGDPDLGHGLGLTFVEAVAKAHNARLSVESVQGSGTSFTLEFRDAKTT
ncbi:MAG: ATP-binding protein [Pseudomonadota bacterium]